MATMFGRFEVLGEISRSETALIYKATDTETNQTVALKTQSLAPLGERAAAFVDALVAEGQSTRELAGQNIALSYGGGEIEGQFCASMEYIQGNSIATMLSRKEGFSIWDLVDITRQICAGLDQAASKGVVHHSLEPAKIMVQWDGLVKILGYGVSRMGLIQAEAGNGLGRILPYCSPEQVRGDNVDARSNLFTWGAILYEMVTGRRAFDATDSASLTEQIQNVMPPTPASLNQRIQPGVSDLIMKALAKEPDARYQAARELIADLELCKDAKKTAPAPSKTSAANAVVSPEARNAAASKFVSASPKSVEPSSNAPAAGGELDLETFSEPRQESAPNRAAAAAAGAGATGSSWTSSTTGSSMSEAKHGESASAAAPVMSAAATKTGNTSSRIAVDPMMAGSSETKAARSFSDLDELPPLKEAAYTPPPSAPIEEVVEPRVIYPRPEQKPKIQPREVAQKAVKEIRTIPPQLLMYSILGAVAIILVICVTLFFRSRSEDDGSTAAPRPVKAVAVSQPAPAPAASAAPQAATEPAVEPEPEVTVRQIERPAGKAAKRPTAPVVIPGQIQVDSNPQGAQILVDGQNNPAWITPFNLTGLAPGKHLVSASKAGYATDVRSVEVASASKSFVVLQLAPNNPTVAVNSNPSGAEVLVDGKSPGRLTPAQFAVEKGAHTFIVRKAGYLDETTTATLISGQNFQFGPALRPLGNADDIRSVGKFKKLFGKGGDSAAEMGTVTVRTQPKGAQIAINQHLLERNSPADFMLGPGNYIVDLTLTGYKPLRKIITVDKGAKLAVDETLEHE